MGCGQVPDCEGGRVTAVVDIQRALLLERANAATCKLCLKAPNFFFLLNRVIRDVPSKICKLCLTLVGINQTKKL